MDYVLGDIESLTFETALSWTDMWSHGGFI